jgi:DNA-binding LacI/PurR family transcriptional regulator
MVAGFDGIPEAARLNYRLTTVCQPLTDMVAQTLHFLGIDGASHDPTDPIPVRLVLRDTIPKAKESA